MTNADLLRAADAASTPIEGPLWRLWRHSFFAARNWAGSDDARVHRAARALLERRLRERLTEAESRAERAEGRIASALRALGDFHVLFDPRHSIERARDELRGEGLAP